MMDNFACSRGSQEKFLVVMNTLPLHLTSFIGRKHELIEICCLIQETRLLTLTGPGGCGKTRLALRVAAELTASFADGICWIELAALPDAAMLPQTLLAVVAPHNVSAEAENLPLNVLVAQLHGKELLLLLDNCEHFVDSCATVVDTLLRSCPALHILATSRENLGVEGEHVWLVPSLTTPPRHKNDMARLSLDELTCYEAVRLFVERASTFKRDFRFSEENAQAVAQICRRLDGIPLAIELAASRTTLLSVEQIASHLDNSFRLLEVGGRSLLPRHRTLRATMDWSYALLSSDEQALLRRLSVFNGGFSLEAAEAICADLPNSEPGVNRDEVLDLLARLVDKSLLNVQEYASTTRYRLLETVRQYCLQKLVASQEEDLIYTRHLGWYLCLAETAHRLRTGPDRGKWITQLENEYDNLRAALEWSMAQDQAAKLVEENARLVIALASFWSFRDHVHEGRVWLDRVLNRNPAISLALRAQALIAGGILASNQNDYAKATDLLEKGWGLTQALGPEYRDHRFIAINFLGIVTYYQDNYDQANRLFGECLTLLQEIRCDLYTPFILSWLGRVAVRQGDFLRATALGKESLTLSQQQNNVHSISATLNLLGTAACYQGELEKANSLLHDSLALSRELGMQQDIVDTQIILATSAILEGDFQQAENALQESLTISREIGYRQGIALAMGRLGEIACHLGEPLPRTSLLTESLVLFNTLGARWHLLHLLESFAFLYMAQRGRGNYAQRATKVLAAVQTHRLAIGAPRPPIEQSSFDSTVAAACTVLGKTVFDALWTEGVTMDLAQTVAAILQTDSDGVVPSTSTKSQPLLRIYALGHAEIYRTGSLVTNAEWSYAKPRELFFYLFCNPPRTREQIGLVLWPDASPSQLRGRLNIALYHLRQALGRTDRVLFANGRYSFNYTLDVWSDFTHFETELHEMQPGRDTPQPAAIRTLEETLRLYRGDFLVEMESYEWIVQRREEIRSQYLNALLTLGQWRFATGEYEAAAESYRQVIAHDPYLECAHRELMRSLASMNAHAKGLHHYSSLVTLLRDDLNTQPAVETVALADSLRRGWTG